MGGGRGELGLGLHEKYFIFDESEGKERVFIVRDLIFRGEDEIFGRHGFLMKKAKGLSQKENKN